jgi:glycosyltransferase involved in cell wall biosynthesis
MAAHANFVDDLLNGMGHVLNIVHVVESLAVGGLERVVLTLVAWQCAQGHSCRIVCLFTEGALAEEARALGVEVVVIGKTKGLDVRAARQLRNVLRQPFDSGRTHVVHTHNPVAHYYAAAASVGLGLPCLINTRHGMGVGRQNIQLNLLYRLALLGTRHAVAVCNAGRDHFVKTGLIPAAKAAVVRNGVAVNAMTVRSPQAKQRLLSELRRPGVSVVIGTVGRLNPVKDQASLLRALARLRDVTNGIERSVELVLVGDGASRPALQALALELRISHCVHFLGMRHDVADLLAGFDVFALPSLSEGYSLALVEAAAAGLPIVATHVGGNADIVEEGATGLLVPVQDVAVLTQALAMLIDNPALRERMGHAGRQWALAQGTVAAMGQAYEALYTVNA